MSVPNWEARRTSRSRQLPTPVTVRDLWVKDGSEWKGQTFNLYFCSLKWGQNLKPNDFKVLLVGESRVIITRTLPKNWFNVLSGKRVHKVPRKGRGVGAGDVDGVGSWLIFGSSPCRLERTGRTTLRCRSPESKSLFWSNSRPSSCQSLRVLVSERTTEWQMTR